jgi:hypothetical protein
MKDVMLAGNLEVRSADAQIYGIMGEAPPGFARARVRLWRPNGKAAARGQKESAMS